MSRPVSPAAAARLPAVTLARACLAAGVPLTLLLDLAAGEALDSTAIMAVEQAVALAATQRGVPVGAERGANRDEATEEIA